ncbi:MAG TPA: flagellar biosynthetic protein FliO [Nitrospira sp.]|nr:flagellar biosynthetic protein FliO [Nitrospira sp.]
MELSEMAVRMASSLALVLALMLVLTALAKRLFGSRLPLQTGTALVQVVASGYVGPRKTIAVVSVAGELLIVGTTQTDIVPLGRLSDPEQVKRVLAHPSSGLGLAGTRLWASVGAGLFGHAASPVPADGESEKDPHATR